MSSKAPPIAKTGPPWVGSESTSREIARCNRDQWKLEYPIGSLEHRALVAFCNDDTIPEIAEAVGVGAELVTRTLTRCALEIWQANKHRIGRADQAPEQEEPRDAHRAVDRALPIDRMPDEMLSGPDVILRSLSTRARNALLGADVTTDSAARWLLSQDEGACLLNTPNFGKKSLEEVQMAFDCAGGAKPSQPRHPAAKDIADDAATAKRYVSDQFLADRYEKTRGTIWRWARDPKVSFPKPFRIGPTTRWDLDEVEAWETAQRDLDTSGTNRG